MDKAESLKNKLEKVKAELRLIAADIENAANVVSSGEIGKSLEKAMTVDAVECVAWKMQDVIKAFNLLSIDKRLSASRGRLRGMTIQPPPNYGLEPK